MLESSATDWGVVTVFVLVYLGMILGGLPRWYRRKCAWVAFTPQ